MSNLRRPVRRIHHFLHIFAGAVTPDHSNEFLDVMPAKFEHRHSGLFVELRHTVVIGSLGDVVKLMLYQCAELQIVALLAVVSSQGDDELRYATEPLMHLLLHSGFLPAPGAEHHLFALSKYGATSLLKGIRCPHEGDISGVKVKMIRVIEMPALHQNVVANPAINLIGRDDSYELGREFRVSQVNGRVWPQLITYRHISPKNSKVH